MNKKEKIKLHRDMINSIIDKETEIAEEITQIINDYYDAHPEVTDIQVLRKQNKKDDNNDNNK